MTGPQDTDVSWTNAILGLHKAPRVVGRLIPVGWVRLGSASEKCHCVFLFHSMLVCEKQFKRILEKANYYLPQATGMSCFRADSRRHLASVKSVLCSGSIFMLPWPVYTSQLQSSRSKNAWAVCVLMRAKKENFTLRSNRRDLLVAWFLLISLLRVQHSFSKCVWRPFLGFPQDWSIITHETQVVD